MHHSMGGRVDASVVTLFGKGGGDVSVTTLLVIVLYMNEIDLPYLEKAVWGCNHTCKAMVVLGVDDSRRIEPSGMMPQVAHKARDVTF